MVVTPIAHILLALLLAPLLQSVISRTKATFAGRRGRPLLQPYRDLAKLLRKGAVYSRTTTWVFRAGPTVGLAAVLMALALLPFGGSGALAPFSGDLVALAYLLALGRLATSLAALDTGSAFEGMGASRRVTFSALTEPVLLLALVALAEGVGAWSLSEMLPAIGPTAWGHAAPVLVLCALALLVVLLAECSRIPVDDPTTHLELTMIHEVMVLDHSGPDLAFIEYGAALELWVLGALVTGVAIPVRTGNPWIDSSVAVVGMLALAILLGVIESTTARLRLRRVPQLLAGAGALATLAMILVLR